MLSDKFRRQLSQEAEQWRREGLIDDYIYEKLAQRYQFIELETFISNRFILILLGLGSVLLGLGTITFVQANWQNLPRGLKVTLLLSLFIGINTIGFYLWRRQTNLWQRRLGKALLFLGALVLGANMAVISQMFYQNEQLYQWYLVWGLGVLVMAYSLRLTWLGILSVLLIGLGYVYGSQQQTFVTIAKLSWLQLILQYMPVLAGLAFVPLAYWCRSRWIFRLGAITVVYSLEANLIGLNLFASQAWIASIACALPPALLWAYRDSLWKIQPNFQLFTSTASTLAITFLGLQFYLLSFYWWWNSSLSTAPLIEEASPLFLSTLSNVLILGGLTIWAWLRLLRQTDLTTTVVAGMIAIGALIPYWHLSITNLPIAAVVIYNLLLFILAVGIVRKGLVRRERRLFWGGMALLIMQIFTRIIEYNTDLLFKSLVFFLCGFGVVAAGLWFERNLRSF
ncbi:MAG: DUF2157 domain-containing protein [Symploca sp. SIO3C6]|nr:DUF2157 domain-containing protein [Symploca sp. SIO3C6]NET04505.1 DUF2157 domain-containing protein [Symploca sp. SIO2B6]